MTNIHATLVCYKNKGILIRGVSGSGKSDLALRLIMNHQAILVADDRVDIYLKDDGVYGTVPETIKNKLEIRGIGIANFSSIDSCKIDLVVDLVDSKHIERLPISEFENLLGYDIPKIKLYAFESSVTCKIIAKICGFIR